MAGTFGGTGLVELAQRVTRPAHLVAHERDGALGLSERPVPGTVGTVPAMYPEWLGDQRFTEAHDVRFPYVAGEMAHGIASVELVEAMARAEMLAFFGAAGLGLERFDRDLERLRTRLTGWRNWGVNLIHRPDDAAMEDEVAVRLLRAGVPKISMSAFLDITPAVVRCAASGLRADATGRIIRKTAVFAKVSRPETAELFLSPPPPGLVRRLVDNGDLTEEEGRLAVRVPVADDITVEADSGGHTDGRPLVAVLPAVLSLARRKNPAVRVGAAGGLGDPAAVAAAFALGAAYVVTGSVNQMSVEAAVSDEAKAMLAQAGVADMAMAPAGDMFELGAKVQVLRRGTMFAGRAARLRQLYVEHPSLESLAAETRSSLEREVFGTGLDEVWRLTEQYWSQRCPAEMVRAQADPKHKMALVFCWYLGNSATWAVEGAPGRRNDYQLWCGPAAGAFNTWAAGSFLAEPGERTVAQIARNLLQGAAVLTRVHQLSTFGARLPADAFDFRPRPLA
ncbi:PfaD family polyunsaturated fatty acid/polyketide biosynthesis protein [Saccharopolyspora gloriosae]|uniref:PfaD family polyunsaturated fatty acid/polyketide biosynthesis protein n=1 Tax=Saccharopolyspora gloriosae TaxID=455344 RepID=UPI001FB82BE3|nr:PfaD family polyunsaturated fatty acid/polyketide biosynthesis protein [Saccharopolyspora gloriosae]